MTNSQCIEVMERVWRWELRAVDAGFISTEVIIKLWYKNGKRTKYYESHTEDLVLSWQGFGRTVEAIRNNKNICSHTRGDFMWSVSEKLGMYTTHLIDLDLFWEAAHLAALEAIANDISKA